MNFWLFKTEPEEFSIDDLAKKTTKTEHWDGVRNYQARNFMRDEMRIGDQAFFYHSNCEEPGIVGIVTVASKAYPDHTAFDKKDKHFDPKSDPDNPRWMMVDVKMARKLKRTISLKELKAKSALKNMRLVQRGNRLSVMPVEKKHWDAILKIE
ncbi:MAG: EVE domain-containing protein [Acidiferrobacterales bacterium]